MLISLVLVSFKPNNYDISIYDIEHGGEFSYSGTVTIAGELTEATKEIKLNSNTLAIKSAAFSTKGTGHHIEETSIIGNAAD
jgi:hypothetical protein